MNSSFAALLISVGLAVGLPLSAAEISPSERAVARQAVAAAKKDHLDEALRLARQARDPVLTRLVTWVDYASGGTDADFRSLSTFVAANPDWPLLSQITRRAEAAITAATPGAEVIRWFDSHPPTTADGGMAYARALQAAGRADTALKVIRQTWVEQSFGPQQERQFLMAFGEKLRPEDHWRRLDRLLWDRQDTSVQRMLSKVDPAHRAVANARLALQSGKGEPEPLLAAVPPSLRDDPGLIYERVRWRRQHDMDEDALDLLTHPSRNKVRPDLWWQERAILARRALQKGLVSRAYQAAADHGLEGGSAYVDAEFLAGWVALRFLDDRVTALDHFIRLHEWASHPMARARAAYWAGRGYESVGDPRARDWFTRAARYPTTYYGQLAGSRMGEHHWPLPDDPQPTAEDVARFNSRDIVAGARILLDLDEDDLLRSVFIRLNDIVQTPGERVLVARLASREGRNDLALLVARRSDRDGVTLVEAGWPVPRFVAEDGTPEKALVLALIRQESGFMPEVVSQAGARGLMQLLPTTAARVARANNVKFHPDLLNDPSINIRLGSAYLENLIDSFDGSYMLALASYNAGPGRARRWIRENGDPRDPNIDVIDWIEMIPFGETRNYVQRVMESVAVYRRRLGKPAGPSLEADLKRWSRSMSPEESQ
ncbi:lytic transglycosylase domain-containing protein [Magnetospirillum molischianum]|uniref:Soluble lytic murein transglycosylase and related regulatory protein n=1 Tax=Magnetospirillum molischianum DSM 120 TaxID=1150626 RepID=H8FNR5_MAGML|nr:lytic transglycosylase domain-containing protein [Magnetospirillum molischianum]CCG40003.1 Soluble lytic murein transglycosylase and related regulatory protein [Magnetospirillum molischianum DSM 120]